MSFSKEIIQKKFSLAATSYDNYSNIQDACSKKLVYLIPTHSKIKKIADIGAGTGATTLQLMQYYSTATYDLFDISPFMLQIAQKKLAYQQENIKYIICDAENYDFNATYDLIISNLSLQWLDDIEKFIYKIMQKTKIFAFSTLIYGSFQEFNNIFEKYGNPPPIKQYPQLAILSNICQNAGKNAFCTSQIFNKKCQNIYKASSYFRNIGANIPTLSPTNNIIRILRDKTSINLEYNVFFGIIYK